MNDELIKRLTPVFARVFNDKHINISPNTTAADIPKWDSFTHMTLIAEIEETFRVSFSYEEVASLVNVGDMLRLLEDKLA
jgi:acyl carrier protein